jgi:phage terminase large subunit
MLNLDIDRLVKHAPLPSQQKFHDSPATFKGFSGPIGSGKSQALCHEAIRLSYLNPGRPGLIGAPTYPMLRDSTLASLTEILETNELPFELNKSDNVLTMKDTDSRILLRPLEDYDRLRGTNLAWFGVDELTYTHEEAWLRLEGRLRDPAATRRCGFAVWTPKGFDWVYRKFVSHPVEGYEAIKADPFENRFLLDQVPDFYERLKASYDENFFRQEALGDYLNVGSGLVYSSFRRDQNVREVEFDPALAVLWTLDFNVAPLCSLVVQKYRDEVRVVDEIVLRRATTEQACEEFERKFGMPRGGVVVFGDANGMTTHTASESTDFQVIRKYFADRGSKAHMNVPKSNPSVRARVGLMNARLCNAEGDVNLIVSPRCKELIDDFEQVAYEEESTQIDKNKDRRRTHASDALGYLVWQECQGGQNTIGERGQRLI